MDMQLIGRSLLVVALIAMFAPDSASARLFRRRSRSQSSNATTYVRSSTPQNSQAMDSTGDSADSDSSEVANSESDDELNSESSDESTEATSSESVVQASAQTSSEASSQATFDVSTAQGVANIMARTGRVGHWGGNPGYEGCGCGSTPQAAYNICCYARSGMATVDVGYAQGSNGMWYCCRRYR
jgi:hypothetical protein